MTHMTLQAVRQLIANDSYAITFQSVEQYRATLLRHFDSLVDGAQPYAIGGTVPGGLHLVGEGLQPLSVKAEDGARAGVTLDEALFALDLVVNKMRVPGLSGQRAFALDVLKRAEAPTAEFANRGQEPDWTGYCKAERAQQAAAPGALAGWKWVPVEPTPEMQEAGFNVPGAHLYNASYRAMVAAAPSAPGTPEAPQTAAARDVLAERQRQVDEEGYDTEGDDGHILGELGAYAAFYAMPPAARDWPAGETGYGATWGEAIVPADWTPPKPGDRRDELVRAAALVLAEIERLDRAAESGKGGVA